MPKSKIFLLLLLAFVSGVALRSFFAIPHTFSLLVVFTAALLFVLGVTQRRFVLLYGALLVMFLLGVLRFDYAERKAPDLGDVLEKYVELQGVVAEDPERKENYQKFLFKVSEVEGTEVPPFKILVASSRFPAYETGDQLAIYGRLEDSRLPNASGAVAEIGFPKIKRVGKEKSPKRALGLIKNRFEGNIVEVLPEPHASLMNGILLGERESFPSSLTEDLKETGTTHIVALSGYNITLVGRSFQNFLLWLTVPFSASFWIATVSIVLFVALTGASPSVVRAAVMGILVLLAAREGRMYQATNALVFAGALMVLHDPTILRFDVAFQLSFLATLGLFYFSPLVESFFSKFIPRSEPLSAEKKWTASPKQILVETLSAQLMVLPLLVYYFGRVSLVSPVTNVLVLEAVPYVMAVGFLVGVTGFLWRPVSFVFGAAAWALLEYVLRVVEFFARVPLASIKLGVWAIVPLLGFYALVFWKLWVRRRRGI